jgi:hypothetical protein
LIETPVESNKKASKEEVRLRPLFSEATADSYKGLHFVPLKDEENANSLVPVVADFDDADDERNEDWPPRVRLPMPNSNLGLLQFVLPNEGESGGDGDDAGWD